MKTRGILDLFKTNSSERNQLSSAIAAFALIAMCVIFFVLIGGEFNFLFISFSADGILQGMEWVVFIILYVAQQLYIVPTFVKSYWKLFSEVEPTAQELYIPVVNENVVLQNDTLVNITYGLWAIIGVLITLMVTPAFSFLSQGSAIIDAMFFCGVGIVMCFAGISLIRGFKYLSIRRDIYDYHNKYLGIRGVSPLLWMYQILYFIPLARSISILLDIQVLDKLTKFNDVEKLKTELVKE